MKLKISRTGRILPALTNFMGGSFAPSFNHSFNKYIGNCTRYKIQFASLMQAGERWQIPR